MKGIGSKMIVATLLGVLTAPATMADEHAPQALAADRGLIASHFPSVGEGQMEVLDAQAMGSTRGELWPLIGAVVTVDLALATFFWGTYVPTMSGTSPTGGLLTVSQD